MELRLLTNENDRRIFAARTEQIRAKHGVGFKERSRSRLARIHLNYGNLYALFEHDGDPAEKMIAGLVMHDLEMFPQTCPRPDLSHLPPRSVLEVSELWSRAIGAGALARAGAAILAGLLDARAILAYLGVRPFDGTPFYRATGFVNAGEPVEYPYLETLQGESIWAQPMILEGESLAKLTRVFSQLIIETNDDFSVLRFKNFLKGKSAGGRPAFVDEAPAVDSTMVHAENAAVLQ
ncbi:hypothetical protein [Candidatus Binatus sp.]|jgi:hypothetical protein|uniref:hypothetical protein n=1 Tax=Candidatus Binatus sp. TaxID=2811406 RepID=UPI003BB1F44F